MSRLLRQLRRPIVIAGIVVAAGAVRLIEDATLRRQIMRNNATYYRDYLRPDTLVKNALTRVLGLKAERG